MGIRRKANLIQRKVDTFARLVDRDKKQALDKLILETKRWRRGNVISDIDLVGCATNNHLLVTHLLSPFLLDSNSSWLSRHQGAWKPLEYVRIFNEIGFKADIIGRSGPLNIPERDKYNIHFGSTPHFFDTVELLSSDTTNIFYSTGNHWNYQNEMLQNRLRMLEKRRGTCITNPRLAGYDVDINDADYMIMMGDQHTSDIYVNEYDFPKSKIYPVTNAGFDDLNISDEQIERKVDSDSLTNFLWFAGSGPVLKGLDLALEVFKDLEQCDLYICGDIRKHEDFKRIYQEELSELPNIHLIGWIDIHSDQFRELTRKCGFHLSPTCSDGISGAVINTMHQGLVPIVTQEAGIDTGEFGFIIDGEISSIYDTIIEASNLTTDELTDRSKRSNKKAKEKYSRDEYISDMNTAIKNIVEKEGLK